MKMSMTYQDSGVDIKKGAMFIERIKNLVGDTYDENVTSGIGGFASLYKIDEDRYLAAGTDGVGTKLKLAQQLGIHHTIGIDLVAMCANDILCTGARPLFFLDYFSSGKLDLKTSENVLKGIVNGCKDAGLALIGGETAEMPGMYNGEEYDLAGFAVGEVFKDKLIDGKKMCPNLTLIGLPSSGAHSNGFSLIRKLVFPTEKILLKKLLTPTKIYTRSVNDVLKNYGDNIQGLAHLTGGGLTNIARMNTNLNYSLNNWPITGEVPELFETLRKRSQNCWEEMFRTFNMGIGFVLATDRPIIISQALQNLGETPIVLGHTTTGFGKVSLNHGDINITL